MKQKTPYGGESLLTCITNYAVRDQPSNLCDFMNSFMVDLTEFWNRHEEKDTEEIIYLFQNQKVPSAENLEATAHKQVSADPSDKKEEMKTAQASTPIPAVVKKKTKQTPKAKVPQQEDKMKSPKTEPRLKESKVTTDKVAEPCLLPPPSKTPPAKPPLVAEPKVTPPAQSGSLVESLPLKTSAGLSRVKTEKSRPAVGACGKISGLPPNTEEDELNKQGASQGPKTERSEVSPCDGSRRWTKRCFACLFEVTRAKSDLPFKILIENIMDKISFTPPVVKKVIIFKQVCLVPLSPCHIHRSLALRPVGWTSQHTKDPLKHVSKAKPSNKLRKTYKIGGARSKH